MISQEILNSQKLLRLMLPAILPTSEWLYRAKNLQGKVVPKLRDTKNAVLGMSCPTKNTTLLPQLRGKGNWRGRGMTATQFRSTIKSHESLAPN